MDSLAHVAAAYAKECMGDHIPGFRRSLAGSSPADVTRMLASLPADAWRMACQALSDLVSCGRRVDAINCNAAMKASSGSGPWAAQFMLFGMRRQQLRPSAVSYVLSMVALGKLCDLQRWELGLSLLGQMRMATMEANERCLSACIGLCSKTGQWSQAVNLLNSLVDEACFNAALLDQPWFQALGWLHEMEELGLRPSFITIDAALRGHQDSHHRWSLALATLSRWKTACEEPPGSLYAATIRACSHARQGRAKAMKSQATSFLPGACVYMCIYLYAP